MMKLLLLTACALMMFFPFTAANAGPDNTAANQTHDGMDQAEPVIQPKAGISWHEQVMKERAIMRRAAEMRNANLRNAQMGNQEHIQDVSLDSYNSLILERNQEMVR
ncbi:MAG: hypothetical protein V1844_03435 [Pseudomonadota bacterium]